MYLPPELRCPNHVLPLAPGNSNGFDGPNVLVCSSGCSVPVVNRIPRFVDSANYAAAFGLQWNAFRKTQLDSYTGTTIFRDRLMRCLGGTLKSIKGNSVLEVGCGAGPFTEILLSAGARVFAMDLSNAVEANYDNHGSAPNYFICQANALNIPALPASFDFVICLGVVQHTPDPEQTMATLASYVKPGGTLVIDHYSPDASYPPLRRIIRPLLLQLPSTLATKLALGLARTLLPAHRLVYRLNLKKWRGMSRVRSFMCKHSPLMDHLDDFPELGDRLAGEWSVLNTHDTLTDRYKHLRSAEEISRFLASCDLVDIEASYAGNGVEARARRPVTVTAHSGARV